MLRTILTPSGLRRREAATLGYSYAGETGRGIFQALGADFAMLTAVSRFGVENVLLLALLSASSFIGYFFSLFTAPLARRGRKKTFILFFEVVSRGLLLLSAAAWSGISFIVPMAAARACANLATPLISGIYGANFCTIARGPAVSRLQLARMVSAAVCGALFAALMRSGTPGRFRYIVSGAAVITLILSLYAWRLPDSRPAAGDSDANSLRDCLRIMAGDGPFMLLEFAWFLLGLANLLIAPLRVLHLHDLGYSDSLVMFCTTTAIFTGMSLSLPLWGRVLYRINFAAYRALANIFITAGIVMFFFARTPVFVCAGALLWGAGYAGGGLSWRLVATFFAHPRRGPAYMAVHTFICGIRGVIGPVIGLYGYRLVRMYVITNLSAGLMIVSTLIILGLVPAVRRRSRDLVATGETPEAKSGGNGRRADGRIQEKRGADS